VVLRASPTVKSLAHVRRLLAAGHGGRGGSQRRHGAVGDTRVVDVPLGTVVYRLDPEAGSDTAALSSAALAGGSQAAQAAPAPISESAPYGLQPAPADSAGGTAATTEQVSTGSNAAAVSVDAPDVVCTHAAVAAPAVQHSTCIVADLVADGDSAVVAAGGAGGRGNVAFHRLQNRPASKRHEAGQPGE
jgi:GTPase involved in cell partitioning and DNA repair